MTTKPVFDDTDALLLKQRQAAFDKRRGPRVGDLVETLKGDLLRFTHDHGKHGIQTTVPGDKYGCSFYFDGQGFLSYSGGLDPCIPKEGLVDTGRTDTAPCWLFHHDDRRAHNGVQAKVTVRVFKQTEVQ